MVNSLEDFLSNRKQRIILNGQCLSWANIHAGVPQVSLLFLIYINDLSSVIKNKCKLFADDKSSFSVVYVIDTSQNDLFLYRKDPFWNLCFFNIYQRFIKLY